MDQLYKDILERLAVIPELQWVDYDTGQIDAFADNYPVPFPAVLVDFENVDWQDVGNKLQGGEVTINIRYAFSAIEDWNNHTPEASRANGLARLRLKNTINAKLHGWGGGHYNRLTRFNERTERRDDGLKVINMKYRTYITDGSATSETTHQIDNLKITK